MNHPKDLAERIIRIAGNESVQVAIALLMLSEQERKEFLEKAAKSSDEDLKKLIKSLLSAVPF